MSGFGGVIKLQGEEAYREALRQIRQSLRETGSSLSAISSSFKSSDKSMDGMRAALEQTNSVLKKHTDDYEKLKTVYDKMASIYKNNELLIESLSKRYREEKEELESIGKAVGTTSEEYERQAKIVSLLEQNLEKSTKKQKDNEIALSKMRTELNNSETVYNKAAAEIDNFENSITESVNAAKKADSAYGALKSTIEKQETELKALKDEYKNVILKQGENSDSAKELASKIGDLSGNLNENKTKLKGVEKAADGLSKSLDDVGNSAKSASGGFSIFKGALANLISSAVKKAISTLKELISATIGVGMNFDTSMSKVSAISGATGDEMIKLRDKAKQMGETTKFTASEVADAFSYMALAGWKTEDMLNGIDGILSLAAASGADLATTSDIVTDALTAMGYSARDAGKFADVMAAASANANTTVEMMGNTFRYAAPIAGTLGYSIEDTAVAIGLMANAGIKAEKAGTALRSILTRLVAPTDSIAKKMESLGISVVNADGTMRPLNEVIEQLRKSFNGLSQEEQAQTAETLAGKEAMSGLLAIINASPEDYKKLTQAIEDSNGASQKMADTMTDNLEGEMTRLKSNVESVQVSIYEKFGPALRTGVEALNGLASAFQFVIDHSGEFAAVLAGITAGIVAFLAVFQGATIISFFSEAILGATTAIKLLGAAIAANPIGAIIVAATALTAAFITLWNTSEDFRNFWIGLWESIKNAAQPVVETLSEWFSIAWEKIKEIWAPIAEFFSSLFNSIIETVNPIIESISNAFQEAWELIEVVWNAVVPFFQSVWRNIEIVFSVVKDVLGAYFTIAWEVIKTVWEVVAPFFQTIWDNIKEVFSVVATVLGEYFKVAWESIKAVWNVATSFFKAIWDSIAGIFKVVKDVLTGNWNDAWEGIKGIVNTWVGFFKNIWANVKNVFASVKDFFENTFIAAWNAVKNVFSNWGKFFGGLWDNIKEKFSTMGTNIANAIGGAVKSGINGVISIIENTINTAIGLINGAINWINKIPGVDIGKLSELNLPRLAQGGVLDNGARTVVAGENGAEAIVPLEKNTRWIAQIANQLHDSLQTPYDTGNKSQLAEFKEEQKYNKLVESFKQALSEMKIEMDSDTMGKFVERTVANAIYS